MNLSQKLGLVFIVAIIIVAGMGYSSYRQLLDTREHNNSAIEEVAPTIILLNDIRYFSQSITFCASELLRHSASDDHDGQPSDHIREARETCQRDLDLLQTTASSYHQFINQHFKNEKDTANVLANASRELYSVASTIVKQEGTGALGKDNAVLHNNLVQTNQRLLILVQHEILNEKQELDDLNRDIKNSLDTAVSAILFGTATLLVVFLGLWLALARKLRGSSSHTSS